MVTYLDNDDDDPECKCFRILMVLDEAVVKLVPPRERAAVERGE